MKPRLLIILNRLVLGGQSIDTIPLANYLKEEYEIKILYGEKEKDEKEFTEIIKTCSEISFQKIPFLKRSINPLNDLVVIYSLYKIIIKFRPSIVHTHGSKPGVVGRLAAWFAKVPVIVHSFHGHLFHSYYNKIISYSIIQLEKFLSRLSTKIIVLSEQQQKEICKRYKILPEEKVKVIPLGAEESLYNKDAVLLRAGFRASFHLSEESIAIGIIGRIVPVKNHRLFVEIIIRLLQTPVKDKVKFFFIGDGYSRKELENHLTKGDIKWSNNKSSCTSTVIFTSWITPITNVLHGLDIVALTSLNEGTPMSLIEAQICGKPVIATDVGGVRDTFIDNESGFLINDHDVTEFANKLSSLVQNKQLRKAMGEKAYTFAKEKFSKQAEVNAFRKLYTECLNRAMNK